MTVLKDSHHFEKGASQAKRFMACPGCIRMQRGIVSQPSRYAAEGTVAHHIGEECLRDGKDAAEFVGKHFKKEGFDFEVTMEMAEAVQSYLDYTRKFTTSADIILAEHALNLEWLAPGLGGTADLVAISGDVIHVMDYKHGAGVFVGAEENPQLMYYGLGALMGAGVPGFFKEVHLHICQPRFRSGPAFSEWVISAEDLIRWGACVLKPCAEACDDPAAPLRPGAHCQFCKVAGKCPGQLAYLEEVSRTNFSEMLFPDPQNLTKEERRKILLFAETAKAIISSVSAAAYEDALKGEVPEGMKLVRKEKKRAWVDEKRTEEALELLVGDAAFTRSLLSPNQTEGVLKKYGVDKATISELWHVPQGGLALVPEGDRRPAVNDFDNDFSDLETEE